jgi:hypothetical protein
MADHTSPVYVESLDTVSERDRHQIGTTDDLEELSEGKNP